MGKDLYIDVNCGKPSGVDISMAGYFIEHGALPVHRSLLQGQYKSAGKVFSYARVPAKDFPRTIEDDLIASMGPLKGKKRTIMLSGGFDSMLLALLARQQGAVVSALTVQFESFNLKTVRRAVLLAKRLGLPHRVISVTVKEFLSGFASATVLTDEPLLDLDLALVEAALRKCSAKDAGEVLVSGMGSDEWFGDLSLNRPKDLQQKFNITRLHLQAHERCAKKYKRRFIAPFLSDRMIHLSLQLTEAMRKDKQLLRALAPNAKVFLPPASAREDQVPDPARAVVVQVYGGRAWPRPIKKLGPPKSDDRSLRAIALGMWLEKFKD